MRWLCVQLVVVLVVLHFRGTLGALVDSTLVVLHFWLWFDDGGLFVVLSPATVPKLGALLRGHRI